MNHWSQRLWASFGSSLAAIAGKDEVLLQEILKEAKEYGFELSEAMSVGPCECWAMSLAKMHDYLCH